MVVVLVTLLLAVAHAAPTLLSVYVNNGNVTYREGVNDPAATAAVRYSPAEDQASHFAILDVATRQSWAPDDQMYAAGFGEGLATAEEVYNMHLNMDGWFMEQVPSRAKVDAFFAEQLAWAQAQVRSNSSSFWQHTGLVLRQLEGLLDGYNAVCDPQVRAARGFAPLAAAPACQPLKMADFLFLNGVGDVLDLLQVLHPETRPNFAAMTPAQREAAVARSGHCSGLIRVTGNYSELFAGHSSWFTYSSMLRIQKHYDFALQGHVPGTAARRVSFSSYPAFLESLDDFYITDASQGIIMVQTTNSVFNHSLYELVHPQSLLAWQRVRVAMTMGGSGKDWATYVSWYNSGTYNNQYMVVDLSRFVRGKQLLPGLLWVVEQIPGLVEAADQTQTLERGYWPSYNVPFFPTIYNRSGYPDTLSRFGGEGSGLTGLDYQMAPRAQIFRRDQGSVVDLPSFKHMLRYNGYLHDPYAKGSPYGAICSRGDLASPPSPDGCYDTKVTTATLAPALRSEIINGPTAQDLPPFAWTAAFNASAHYGQPSVFDFDFEPTQPTQL